jgi:hypothetical protein
MSGKFRRIFSSGKKALVSRFLLKKVPYIPEVRKTDSYLSVRNNTTLHISIDGSKEFLVSKTLIMQAL